MFNRLKSFARFQKIKEWYIRYERFLIPGSLVLGVIVDAVTFRSIDLKIAFSILFAHLVLSLLTITFAGLYDVGKIKVRGRSIEYLRLFAPLVIQYTFGALLSGFLIFYGFGGTVAASWPFILMIVFLLVSNDLLKRHYVRLIVQISVYYFCLFSFLALVFQVWFLFFHIFIFFRDLVSAY
jgi:hypothetical protein